jgi:hypothetical protein
MQKKDSTPMKDSNYFNYDKLQELEFQLRNESNDFTFARDLLKPGFPFSIRDQNNKRVKIQRRVNEFQTVNLMPNLERAYNLCLEGKCEKAAKLISEITGLLVAAEIDLGTEYLVEVEVRNQMPRMLSQIRRELRNNVPSAHEPEAKSA